jgi:hypothetical protein
MLLEQMLGDGHLSFTVYPDKLARQPECHYDSKRCGQEKDQPY